MVLNSHISNLNGKCCNWERGFTVFLGYSYINPYFSLFFCTVKIHQNPGKVCWFVHPARTCTWRTRMREILVARRRWWHNCRCRIRWGVPGFFVFFSWVKNSWKKLWVNTFCRFDASLNLLEGEKWWRTIRFWRLPGAPRPAVRWPAEGPTEFRSEALWGGKHRLNFLGVVLGWFTSHLWCFMVMSLFHHRFWWFLLVKTC